MGPQERFEVFYRIIKAKIFKNPILKNHNATTTMQAFLELTDKNNDLRLILDPKRGLIFNLKYIGKILKTKVN